MVSGTPRDRFDMDRYFSSNPDDPGTTYSRKAGYVERPFAFDAAFFGISAAEALEMDPQQRWLLELCWTALENAGLVPADLRGARVGLFLTTGDVDYGRRTMSAGDPARITAYAKLGANRAVGVGRIAHLLGLQGPAIFVDTTCSSSLVTVHLAAQSLASGDCDLALAGGVNLILGPEETIGFARLRAMSPSDSCRSFDSRADGYIRGEGGGVVVLRRFAEAVAASDRIEAIIAGSAINNDGASNGLTAPNGAAQEQVIRAALARAGAQPEEVAYVEAHGTGTPLGDPIELTALRDVYGSAPGRRSPLLLGAVKAQIGHLEAGAGIAGLIKAALVQKHRCAPPQASFDEPNPRFRWDGAGLKVPTAPTGLAETAPLVGVSSFGLSGTNSHLLLAPAPPRSHPVPGAAQVARVLPISARSPEALGRMTERFARYIAGTAESIRDICYTAAARREHWEHRVAFVGRTTEDFVEALAEYARGEPSGRWHSGNAPRRRKLIFLFPGQGGWRPGVGSDLYKKNLFYRAEVDKCLSLLCPASAARTRSALLERDSDTLGHEPGQLAHFITLHSLARMWLDLGLRPDAVVGHSLGEHAAAVIAGIMSLEDGLAAAEARGRLFAELAPPGAMLAVGASEPRLRELLTFGRDLFVAAVNAPGQTVISGTAEAVGKAQALLGEAGIRTSSVPTYGTPGHSPLLEPLLEPFGQVLAKLSFARPRIDFVSSVTGEVEADKAATADYWLDLVHRPVLFDAALRSARGDDGTSAFLEVGPGSTLANLARLADPDAAVVTTLAEGPDGDAAPEDEGFAHACARLYGAGLSPDWTRLYGGVSPPAAIPSYSFERTHFEIPPPPIETGVRIAAFPGAVTPSPPGDRARRTEGEVSPRDPAWVADHVVMDRLVFPGAAMLLAAANLASKGRVGPTALTDVTLSHPLIVEGRRVVHVAVEDGSGANQVSVHSRAADEAETWQQHLCGRVATAPGKLEPLAAPSGGAAIDASRLYAEAEARGLRLSNDFRRVSSITTEGVWTRAGVAPRRGAGPLAESDLDSAFQAAALILLDHFEGFPVPVAIGELRLRGILQAEAELGVVSRVAQDSADGLRSVDFDCYCGDELIVSARDLQLRDSATLSLGVEPRLTICRRTWVPVPAGSDRAQPLRHLLVTPDGAELAPDGPGRRSCGIDALREPVECRALFERIGLAGGDMTVLAGSRDDESPQAALQACGRLLGLYQAMLAQEEAPRLVTLLTTGAVEVGEEGIRSPAGAALRALARTFANETPDLAWRLIDSDGPLVAEALAAAPAEADLALRGGRWHRAAVEAEAEPPVAPFPVAPDRWHLVFGAFGAIGPFVARWLYERGARRILLAGRSAPATIDSAEFPDAEIRIERCDLTDAARVEALLDAAEATAPLGCLFHCAARLDDGLAASLTQERAAAVLAPKIAGGWALHEATKKRGIQQLVLFGSIADWIGNPGQAPYAAGNAFLEALARLRRHEGLPALAVAWGLWDGASTSVGDDVAGRWSGRGLLPLSASEALETLGELLAADLSNRLVARIDFDRFFRRRPHTDGPAGAASGAGAAGTCDDAMQIVAEIAGQVSGRTADLDGDTALTSLGFDSLALMEFRARLQKRFGRAAPVGLFMAGASLRKLAEFYGAGRTASAPSPAPEPETEPAQEVVEILL
jgi:acyl transferase domain-containing protein